MSPEDPHLNQINRIFEEAVLLHGGDVKKVVTYVKARIGAANRKDHDEINRVFARVTAFRAPDCPPEQLN
jgi:hypothetical protein